MENTYKNYTFYTLSKNTNKKRNINHYDQNHSQNFLFTQKRQSIYQQLDERLNQISNDVTHSNNFMQIRRSSDGVLEHYNKARRLRCKTQLNQYPPPVLEQPNLLTQSFKVDSDPLIIQNQSNHHPYKHMTTQSLVLPKTVKQLRYNPNRVDIMDSTFFKPIDKPMTTQANINKVSIEQINNTNTLYNNLFPTIINNKDLMNQSVSSSLMVSTNHQKVLSQTVYFSQHQFQRNTYTRKVPPRDSSIDQATREFERRSRMFDRLRTSYSTIQTTQQDVKLKREIMNIASQSGYTNILNDQELFNQNPLELREKVLKRIQRIKANKAAVQIQRFFRMTRERQEFQRQMRLRNNAAAYIALIWRRKKWERIFKQAEKQQKQNAALTIQKLFRGRQARKQVAPLLAEKREEKNKMYFQKLKSDLYESAQIKIRYHWLKYKKRKIKQEQIQEEIRIEKERVRREQLALKQRKSLYPGKPMFNRRKEIEDAQREANKGPKWVLFLGGSAGPKSNIYVPRRKY